MEGGLGWSESGGGIGLSWVPEALLHPPPSLGAPAAGGSDGGGGGEDVCVGAGPGGGGRRSRLLGALSSVSGRAGGQGGHTPAAVLGPGGGGWAPRAPTTTTSTTTTASAVPAAAALESMQHQVRVGVRGGGRGRGGHVWCAGGAVGVHAQAYGQRAHAYVCMCVCTFMSTHLLLQACMRTVMGRVLCWPAGQCLLHNHVTVHAAYPGCEPPPDTCPSHVPYDLTIMHRRRRRAQALCRRKGGKLGQMAAPPGPCALRAFDQTPCEAHAARAAHRPACVGRAGVAKPPPCVHVHAPGTRALLDLTSRQILRCVCAMCAGARPDGPLRRAPGLGGAVLAAPP